MCLRRLARAPQACALLRVESVALASPASGAPSASRVSGTLPAVACRAGVPIARPPPDARALGLEGPLCVDGKDGAGGAVVEGAAGRRHPSGAESQGLRSHLGQRHGWGLDRVGR